MCSAAKWVVSQLTPSICPLLRPPKENLYFTSSKCFNVILRLFNQSENLDSDVVGLFTTPTVAATTGHWSVSRVGWLTAPPGGRSFIRRLAGQLVSCPTPNKKKNNLRQRSLLTRKKISPGRYGAEHQKKKKKNQNGRRRTCWHRYRSAILGPGPIRRILLRSAVLAATATRSTRVPCNQRMIWSKFIRFVSNWSVPSLNTRQVN